MSSRRIVMDSITCCFEIRYFTKNHENISCTSLAGGDDHETLGLLAAVGDDAALREVARLAPDDQLPRGAAMEPSRRVIR